MTEHIKSYPHTLSRWTGKELLTRLLLVIFKQCHVQSFYWSTNRRSQTNVFSKGKEVRNLGENLESSIGREGVKMFSFYEAWSNMLEVTGSLMPVSEN